VYDVAIVGAGPAGATCALALKNSGLRVLLLDKAHFPRDKVCGDAIPARCAHVLRGLDPDYLRHLSDFPAKTTIRAARVVAPNRRHFDYHFSVAGYCATRLRFDHFLLELALREARPDFRPGTAVRAVTRAGDAWQLDLDGDQSAAARVLVACDGAQSRLARALTGRQLDPKHHCAAVRGYYRNVAGTVPDRMEIHFVEDFLPGYFWLFPLPEGVVNVGFGMMSHALQARGLALRQALPQLLDTPGLAERFVGAEPMGRVQGFGLPMGSRKVPLSGPAFLLCGDAASLVDPATGEGIGNAMWTGRLAAEVVRTEIGQGTKANWSRYDQMVYGKLWRELRSKYLVQRFLGNRKAWMNFLVKQADQKGPVRWLMRKVF